jgi:hypothetical protein
LPANRPDRERRSLKRQSLYRALIIGDTTRLVPRSSRAFRTNAASPNFRYWLTHLWAVRKGRFASAATDISERRSSRCGWMSRNRDVARSRAASDTPLSSCIRRHYAK